MTCFLDTLANPTHWHLLCKRQCNCGDTDHWHWHFLCKRQYKWVNSDHSRRHLPCKPQYNCGNSDHSHRHHPANANITTTTRVNWTRLRPRPLPAALAAVESLTAVTQTVANCCRLLQPQTQLLANADPPPDRQKWNGNLRYAFGKKS